MDNKLYPYYQPNFAEYNIAQKLALPYLDKDNNLVISFATAVGKTVLAEYAFAYHLQQDKESRVVYVCPFRSLAFEKYDNWSKEKQLNRYGIAIVTGDTITDILQENGARIIIMTSESFDSRTRSGVYRDLLKQVVCIVYDEAHLLGDKNRGSAIEMSIMRMARINKKARFILLSATLSNATEVAKWLKTLNGKPTKSIKSNWRPVKINIKYFPVEGKIDKVNKAVELAKELQWFKTIVFVNSKVTGAEIVKKLRAERIRAMFHNASLPKGKRRLIEEKFKDRMSGYNILVSTSTLSSGVNMAL